MDNKYVFIYCHDCRKKTKHEIVRCMEPIGRRIFLGIISFGVSETQERLYQCECTKCGNCNEADL